jgi:hypothetical protein
VFLPVIAAVIGFTPKAQKDAKTLNDCCFLFAIFAVSGVNKAFLPKTGKAATAIALSFSALSAFSM